MDFDQILYDDTGSPLQELGRYDFQGYRLMIKVTARLAIYAYIIIVNTLK